MNLLRHNGNFRRFWLGQTVSTFGDQVTLLALPSVAILILHVSVFELGVLEAAAYVGFPIFGLVAGAWVDRLPRRRVLIAANSLRLIALGTLPILAAAHLLDYGALIVVSLLTGAAAAFFAAAYQAYVPTVTTRSDLVEGNALLETSNSAAQVAGPSLTGLLIGALGAATAIVADVCSYAVSIVSLLLIRGPETRPERPRRPIVRDVHEGLQIVWRHRLLRRLVLASSLANLGRGLALELFLLFAYRALHLSPTAAGVLLATGNVGVIFGSLAASRLPRRVGLGRTLWLAGTAKGIPWLFLPLALYVPPVTVAVPVLAVSGFFIPVWNVTSVSLRQTLTDDDVLGRVAATVRTLTWTAIPLSGLIGGVLGTVATSWWGQRTGLAVVLALGGLLWAGATTFLPRVLFGLHDAKDVALEYGRIAALTPA